MEQSQVSSDEIRDELPEDLNVTAFVGPYKFPDNSRRRIPGAIYVLIALLLIVLRVVLSESDSGLIGDGLIGAAILLGIVGLFSLTSSWRMTVDEKMALVYATRSVGFAVGHASAQQVWRGLRSRPTWRVMCYSAQEPPLERGLVLIDAIDARIYECLVEANPES